MKKAMSLLMSVILLVVLMSGCTDNTDPGVPDNTVIRTPEETQRLFDEFLEKDFLGMVTSDTLTLHSVLKDPEAYGITDHVASWGSLNFILSKEEMINDRGLMREFGSFDRSHLTEEQKQSYDIYAYDLALYRDSIDTYYYYSPFRGSNGYHAMLPIILSEYAFFNQKDVEDYLVLLGTVDEYFGAFIEFEQERSARGLFMTDAATDDVIQGCRDFLSTAQDNILLKSFSSRLEGLEEISDEKKQEYIEKNEELFDTVIIPTYENLIIEMGKLKGTGTNSGGLANYELGREYYTYRLKAMGISKSPEEIIEMSDRLMGEYYAEMWRILAKDSSIYDRIDDKLTPEMTAEEIMEYLKERCKEDFPAIPDDVSYSLSTIDDSLKDFVAPAFYFIPRLDDYTSNSIYYNADYFGIDRDYMFFTLAHEGYPGHLLQNVSVMHSPLSDWRKTQGFTAYSEGWANYVQYYAYRYVDTDQALADVLRLNEEMTYMMMLRIDVGVNYEGWTMGDMKTHLEKETPFGSVFSQNQYEYYYNYVVNNPMSIVPYIVGMVEIRELSEYYKAAMGSAYSDMLFHEEYLKRGEAPFALIKQWMDEALLGQSSQAA